MIVPDFGAFLTNYAPASIDHQRHVIHPPGKTIAFNGRLQTSDGLLLNYLARHYDLQYERAGEQVQEVVQSWKQQLRDGEALVLEEIGTLRLNQDGRVEFTPADNRPNLLLEAFGLQDVHLEAVKRDKQGLERHFVHKHEERKLRRRFYVPPIAATITALVLMVALLVYGLAQEDFSQGLSGLMPPFLQKEQTTLPAETSADLETAEPAEEAVIAEEEDHFQSNYEDYMAEEQDTQDAGKALYPDETEVETPAEPAAAPKPEAAAHTSAARGTFYIIGGSFEKKKNASKLAAQLEAMGYQPQLMNTDFGHWRVAAKQAATEQEALQLLEEYQRQNPNAWILNE